MDHFARDGWVYLLHHREQQALADALRGNLNRLGYPIWDRKRDVPDLPWREAHRVGFDRAAFIVILDSEALRRSSFALSLADRLWHRRIETIHVEMGGDPSISPFRSSLTMSLPGSERKLAGEIDRAMKRLSPWARHFGAPKGRRARQVLLSYASKDAARATQVRRILEGAGKGVWDYAVAPRSYAAGDQEEIFARIKSARTVVIVLTAAWQRSSYCVAEFECARREKRRRLWLRFGNTLPLEPAEENVIDVRPWAREAGFQRLVKAI